MEPSNRIYIYSAMAFISDIVNILIQWSDASVRRVIFTRGRHMREDEFIEFIKILIVTLIQLFSCKW